MGSKLVEPDLSNVRAAVQLFQKHMVVQWDTGDLASAQMAALTCHDSRLPSVSAGWY